MKPTLQETHAFHWRRFAGLTLAVAVIASATWLYLNKLKNRIRHVLLVSIDTCRADHLSCYGYSRKTTPHIDQLAAEGIRFEKTKSQTRYFLRRTAQHGRWVFVHYYT